MKCDEELACIHADSEQKSQSINNDHWTITAV